MMLRRLSLLFGIVGVAVGLVACTQNAQPPKAENKPPMAAMEFAPTWGEAPLKVYFSAAQSSDPDGTIVSYVWSFGDGAQGNGMFAEHEYTKKGSFVVTLTVTDDKGATSFAKGTVFVIEPPAPPPPSSSGRTDKIENDLIIYTRTVPDALSSGGNVQSHCYRHGEGGPAGACRQRDAAQWVTACVGRLAGGTVGAERQSKIRVQL
jgi:PKD repeat protein